MPGCRVLAVLMIAQRRHTQAEKCIQLDAAGQSIVARVVAPFAMARQASSLVYMHASRWHSKERVRSEMLNYGPGFKEILLQRRRFTSSLVAVIQPWDVPADLRQRVVDFWDLPGTEQAAPVEDSMRMQWFLRPFSFAWLYNLLGTACAQHMDNALMQAVRNAECLAWLHTFL